MLEITKDTVFEIEFISNTSEITKDTVYIKYFGNY